MEDLSKKTEDELLAIIRASENSHISGSRYQRAVKELELRDREKINKGPTSGIFLRVGGDIVMDGGSIESDSGVIDIMTAGNYKNKGGSIKHGVSKEVVKAKESIWKEWWMEFLVYPLLVGGLLLSIPSVWSWVVSFFVS